MSSTFWGWGRIFVQGAVKPLRAGFMGFTSSNFLLMV